MSIIKYIQLPFHFDPKRLQEEMKNFRAGDWQMHYQTSHYEGEWSAIPLRSQSGKSDNIYISPMDAEYKDTIHFREDSYFREVLSEFKCPIQAVRLLKLNAGAEILEHRDADLCFEKGEIRLHIPVITSPEVEFWLDKERIFAQEGECWYMNFNLPHSISNKSGTDRIHLVIDGLVNDWVKEIFLRPELKKKEIEEAGYDDHTKKNIIESLRALNTETANRIADEMEAAGYSVN